jgi:mitochondrial import receptor subunit TOM40
MSQANNAPHSSGIQAEGEFRGNTWNLSGRFGNPSNVGLSYTQTVTKSLTLGMDIIYAGKQGISMVNSGLRYEKGDMCVAGTLNAAQLGVAVSRKFFNQATLVTELQTTWASGALDTNYAVGADYMLRTSHLKARVDSNRKVTCYLEEMLNQHTRFSLSAELDHKKKSYKFGFGVGMAI